MLVVLVLLGHLILLGYVEGICSNDPDGAFLADPSSRSHYFYCWQGQKIRRECKSGLEFNPFDRVCNLLVGGRPMPQPARDQCFDQPDGTFLVDPSSRSRFFFCSNGLALSGQCDPGFEFHPRDNVCERIEEVTSSQDSKNLCSAEQEGNFFPVTNSRTSFLHCSNGVLTQGNCPRGMIFDSDSLVCESNSPTPTRATPTTKASKTTRATPRPPIRPPITRAPPRIPTRAPSNNNNTTTKSRVPPSTARPTRAPPSRS
ncbi:CLUMA_CG015908, isoform A [Clunio marinus]|uniref:CLUMA_CG015908, isoform A n=1 Tax=Clunio marinus TaxID=568069 RepID=A0A1J1ISL3_9DIPT|nr:CLUMA_CG015908, isoform A [Clunio marinus]